MYAHWKLQYVTFTGNGYNSTGKTYLADGTTRIQYAQQFTWQNNTGAALSVTITISDKAATSGDESHACSMFVSPNYSSTEDPELIMRVSAGTSMSYKTQTLNYTIPAGYYLTWFQQYDADTYVTVKMN